MNVNVININGWSAAMIALKQSKRHSDMNDDIKLDELVTNHTTRLGSFMEKSSELSSDEKDFYNNIEKVIKWGSQHTTLLKFVDFTCCVYELHRGGQDDFDAHADRLDNRIVRSSTRLAEFKGGEKSEYYEGKVLSTDEVLNILNIDIPEMYTTPNGDVYIKTVNGYIKEEYKDDQDVKRGLYMLDIPSTFIFKCDLVEFAHIVKMRDKNSHAHPELRECIEKIITELETMTDGYINREFFYNIPN